MKSAMAEHDDSFGGRARESVTGWWGRSRRFLSEVRNEMGRVTWPSRKEVYATTFVVILTSIFFGRLPRRRRFAGLTSVHGLDLQDASERHDEHDRRPHEAVVHRPHVLGLREQGQRVARAARAGVRAPGRDRRDPHPDRAGRRDARRQEGRELEAVLPRLHPGRDAHVRPRVARREEHAEGDRVRRRRREADAALA